MAHAEEPNSLVSEGEVPSSLSKGAESSFPSQLPACEGEDLRIPEFLNLETAGLCCSARVWKKSAKALEVDETTETKKLSQFNFFDFFGGSKLYFSLAKHRDIMHTLYSPAGQSFFTRSVNQIHHTNMHFDGTFNIFSRFSLAALNDSNDVYTYREMLKQPDVSNFVEAMVKEVMDHEERRHWICVP